MNIAFPVISFELYNEIYGDIRVFNLNNGHTILIPEENYNELIQSEDFVENINKQYFKVFSENNQEIFSVFGKVGFIEENHIVLPQWTIDKLNIKIFDLVCCELMEDIVDDICFIKIQADNSSYTNLVDIKGVFEQEMSKCLAIAMGDTINMGFYNKDDSKLYNIKFNVKEIKNEIDEHIEYGSLRDTEVKVEFDIPLDIIQKEIEKERERIKMEEEAIEMEKKRLEELEKENERLENERKGFKGNGNSLKDPNEKILSREEALRLMEERFNNQNK